MCLKFAAESDREYPRIQQQRRATGLTETGKRSSICRLALAQWPRPPKNPNLFALTLDAVRLSGERSTIHEQTRPTTENFMHYCVRISGASFASTLLRCGSRVCASALLRDRRVASCVEDELDLDGPIREIIIPTE